MKVIKRGNSYRVAWRLDGTRDGASQSYSSEDEDRAKDALELVKRRKKAITKEEVYHLIDGVPREAIMMAAQAAAAPAAEEPPEPTFAEWSDEYFRHKTQLSPSQIGQYKSQLRREIFPALGELRLSEITAGNVGDLVKYLGRCDCKRDKDGKLVKGPICLRAKNGHGLDSKTVDRYYSLVYSVLRYAVLAGKIKFNPCDITGHKRNGIDYDDADDEDSERVYLTEAEALRIRSLIHADSVALFDYMLGTGARWSEATAALVSSVDATITKNKPLPTVKIYRAWKKRPPSERTENDPDVEYPGTTKGRAKRTIEIDEELMETLKPLIKGQPKDALLFRATKGGRVIHTNFMGRRWKPAIIAAMRCEEHPPLAEGKPALAEDLAGPLCGDNGGVRNNNARRKTGQPCGRKVEQGWNRCMFHKEIPKDAVSTCECPHVLKKRPRIHDLRHTHATWLLDDGEALHDVSERLGHRSSEVTERIYKGYTAKGRNSMAKSIGRRMRRVRGLPEAA